MTNPDRGHAATKPTAIPFIGWRDILMRVWKQMGQDNLSLVAGGMALFGLLATAPAIVAIVSIYGLFAAPDQVTEHLQALQQVMPSEASTLLTEQIRNVAQRDDSVQGFGILVGIGLALWSARTGIRALIRGLNMAYYEKESRGFVQQLLLSLAFTAGAIVTALVVMGLTVVAPLTMEALEPNPITTMLVFVGRWALLWLLVGVAISLVYRLAPSRGNPAWRWVQPGSMIAAALWLAASFGFSLYVRNFGDYGETYGAMGGVVVLLLWFQLSAFVILLGARLNAEIEHQTVVDTTAGPDKPMGRRGAAVADTTPDS